MTQVVARQSFRSLDLRYGTASGYFLFPHLKRVQMADIPEFEILATIDQIPEDGTLAVTRSDGRRICLIRSNGRVRALADNCTHQDFEMSLGDVLPDGTIQCAWHGARFDCATGAVRQGPATVPLPVYPVKLQGVRVLVGPEEGA